MSIPKEPRQMMINMMYLVLTALLALNVSAEILNAFKIVDKGISKAKDAITTKNNITYTQLEMQWRNKPERAGLAYTNAQRAKKLAAKLDKEIEVLKQQLIAESGGLITSGTEKGALKNDQDMEAGVRLFIEDGDGKNGKLLQQKINESRKQLYALIPCVNDKMIAKAKSLEAKSALRADDYHDTGKTEIENKWYFKNFHMVPVVAALAILNGIQQNLRSAEADVIDECLASLGENLQKFDGISAEIVPDGATVVPLGQPFRAKAFLAAFDTKQQPEIKVNGMPVNVKDGQGLIELNNNEGEHELNVEISLKDDEGNKKTYQAKPQKYKVIKPFASVSLDQMNVLYVGLENPITISAAGFTADKVDVSISQGVIKGSAGKYFVSQTKTGTANVTVYGTVLSPQGKKRITIGTYPFRIKEVPPPLPYIGNSSGGAMALEVFMAQTGVRAVLENFPYNYPYVVQSFEISVSTKRNGLLPSIINQGPYFTQDTKKLLQQLRKGDMVTITDIYAKGPGAPAKKLGSLTIKMM